MTSNWIALAGLIFAVVFAAVGMLRIVEITSLKLGRAQTRILIPLHVVGTLLFSAAIALAATDERQAYRLWISISLGAGLVILFPLHIYINLKRRLRYTRK